MRHTENRICPEPYSTGSSAAMASSVVVTACYHTFLILLSVVFICLSAPFFQISLQSSETGSGVASFLLHQAGSLVNFWPIAALSLGLFLICDVAIYARVYRMNGPVVARHWSLCISLFLISFFVMHLILGALSVWEVQT